jgi:hypothetical protein
MPRTKIEYRTHNATSKDGPWRCYLFYPDGVWDEEKLNLQQAQKKYPQTDYNWVDVSDEDR